MGKGAVECQVDACSEVLDVWANKTLLIKIWYLEDDDVKMQS